MLETTELLSLTSEACLQAARRHLANGRGHATAIWRRALRAGRYDPEAMGLSAAAVADWRRHFRCTLPEVVGDQLEDGPLGSTRKFVLRLASGRTIEAVSFPVGGQLALCISSQVGCKMGCTFCETGRLGLLQNLAPHEIVGQVVAVAQVLGRAPDRVVYMGMGEALDNVEAVIASLHILADRRGFAFAQERLTVCTSGHVAGLRRLAELGWSRLNLSVSLNAAVDELRDAIMPVNRRTPLAELQRELIAYRPRRNFCFGINYCLLPGINDDPAQARAIADFCRPLGRVLVSLIPYNPGNAPLTRAPTEAEVEAFVAALREHEVPVRRRITKGRSIMAACGQLGDVSQRRRSPDSLLPADRDTSPGEAALPHGSDSSSRPAQADR